MTAKKSNLLAALKKPEAMAETPAPTAARSQEAGAAKRGQGAASSREGKSPMTNWLDDAFPATLEMLKAQLRSQGRKATREELVAEGLNLLFEKYNMPTVRK